MGALLGLITNFGPKLLNFGKGIMAQRQSLAVAKIEAGKDVRVATSKQLAASWKDEYVTVLITAPIGLVVAGTLWGMITGTDTSHYGIQLAESINAMLGEGVEYGHVLVMVVMAAIGLRVSDARWAKHKAVDAVIKDHADPVKDTDLNRK